MFTTKWIERNKKNLAILLALVPLFDLVTNSVSWVQETLPNPRLVRVMETAEMGVPNPAGLAFSPSTGAFYIIEGQKRGWSNSDLIEMTPFTTRAGSARIAAVIRDPRNMTFDGERHRLLIYQSHTNRLIEVREGPVGDLDPEMLMHHNVSHFGLQSPQGMTVDPTSGNLFFLDVVDLQLIRVEPETDGTFDKAVISVVDLEQNSLSNLQGLAFDPTSSHLHLLAGQELYELTQTGQVVAIRDLSEFGIRDPQGLVFAPSSDQTDDPAEINLFITDQGDVSAQTPGGIVELSFSELVMAAPSSFTSSLVNVVDLSAWSPPSPDPSGLTYRPGSNTLWMGDGEVEETVNGITHFQGANVWEFTLSGSVVDTANISKIAPTFVPMTNEPTGVTWNPVNGHFFFSDDGAKEVFDLNPGADGLVGTADDSWTSFDTLAVGNGDPEGIAFDTWNNRLFVADGVNREVYQYTLSGNLVSHFDVLTYGVEDPESVEFNPDSGTLFVMSSNRSSPVIVETTLSGILLQMIDISAASARAAAGLAYAPASNGSATKRFYIVDRGIDNNSDPRIIDGKMYEMTTPTSPVNAPPIANDDTGSTNENTAVTINVAANDTDPDGNLDPASARTTCGNCTIPANGTLVNNGDGSFTYTPDTDFNGLDGFVYEICDTEALCDTAFVSITVNPTNAPPVANDDNVSTNENTAVTINVAINDTDPNGNLNLASANTDCPGCAYPANGALVNHGDGSFTYTPSPGFTGSDSFIYEICDSTFLCDTATVTISVTQPGSDLIFADGFESGDLSAWSSVTTDSGDLSVSTVAALSGNYGLQAVIDDNIAIYVTDQTPNAEPRYRTRVSFDPNSILMANNNNHFIFYGDSRTTPILRVQFRFRNGNYQLRVAMRNDSTTWFNTSWFTVSDAPHAIELDWQASTAAGVNNGGLTLWIDGIQRASLTGIDNDTRRIDRVRLGAVAGIDAGTRGIYYFDAFESRR